CAEMPAAWPRRARRSSGWSAGIRDISSGQDGSQSLRSRYVSAPMMGRAGRDGCRATRDEEASSMMPGADGTDPHLDLQQPVEGRDGISVIRGGGNCRSWNNIQYRVGLSAKNVGSSKLSMNVATIPPGGVAYAHIHVGFEL